jgi:hypothetical protein
MAKRSRKAMRKEGDRLTDLSINQARAAEAVKGGVTKVKENLAQKELLRKAQRELEKM